MEQINSKRNWWIPAFVVMTLAFEVAREWAVVAQSEPISGSSLFVHWSPQTGYATAEGQWIRSDGGSPILPNSVSIRCERDPAPRCIEASSSALGSTRSMHTTVDIFDNVKFSEDGVTYTNPDPTCATYTVHIDGSQRRVTATRTAKAGAECIDLERRVAMELNDGIKAKIDTRWHENHFLPIASTLRYVLD